MTLRAKQSAFAVLVARLILQAQALGFESTLGEAYRSPEEAARLAGTGAGIARSLHCDRLALDLLLFRQGKYLTLTEDYRPLGEWWEQQSTVDLLCRWGGRFKRADGTPKPDGNHFSVAHEGRA